VFQYDIRDVVCSGIAGAAVGFGQGTFKLLVLALQRRIDEWLVLAEKLDTHQFTNMFQKNKGKGNFTRIKSDKFG